MQRLVWIAAVLLLLIASTSVLGDTDEDEKRRSIRLKTTGQLKKIFAELEISNYQESMTKQQLQDLAFETNAVEQWLELHPEKRRKKPQAASFGENKPEGMDQAQWERLLLQMQGGNKKPGFDHIKDPERRGILEKLSAAGLVMPGSEDMEIEKLRNLAKILDGIPNMQADANAGNAGGDGSGGGSKDEEDVQEL